MKTARLRTAIIENERRKNEEGAFKDGDAKEEVATTGYVNSGEE